MNKFKLSIIFIFVCNLIGNDGFYIPETNARYFEFIILTSTNLHPGSTCFQDKHSVEFSYPGFFSPLGELNWLYKNTNNSSIHLGIGYPYLTVGLFKEFIPNVYLNVNIAGLGNIHKIGYYWGALGLSKINQIANSSKFEYYFDVNFCNGVGAIFYGIPYNRGIIVGGNYIKKLNSKFQITIGTGIAINQFRQHKFEYGYEWNYSKTYNYSYNNYNVKNKWILNVQPILKFSINYDL